MPSQPARCAAGEAGPENDDESRDLPTLRKLPSAESEIAPHGRGRDQGGRPDEHGQACVPTPLTGAVGVPPDEDLPHDHEQRDSGGSRQELGAERRRGLG